MSENCPQCQAEGQRFHGDGSCTWECGTDRDTSGELTESIRCLRRQIAIAVVQRDECARLVVEERKAHAETKALLGGNIEGMFAAKRELDSLRDFQAGVQKWLAEFAPIKNAHYRLSIQHAVEQARKARTRPASE